MLFPEGSNQHPSEASPEVWNDWKHSSELAVKLEKTASELIAAADQGQESSRAAFGEVAAACKACHSDFRIKK
ncbi:cytochrome c [Nisaea sp.]|uniref:c-type cytochrome n=1 Tax=Nisaea sp. TaxID=2024842 RepID=UPI0032EF710F